MDETKPEAKPAPKCPYCYKPIEKPVSHRIIYRDYDPARRKQCVRERTMEFCTPECGSNYQMGCEG